MALRERAQTPVPGRRVGRRHVHSRGKLNGMSPSRHEADAIVVGAGLSGMIAARQLLAAGLVPLVLEADDRVGGRILTEEVLPGVPLELGAQWIGDTHERMWRSTCFRGRLCAVQGMFLLGCNEI